MICRLAVGQTEMVVENCKMETVDGKEEGAVQASRSQHRNAAFPHTCSTSLHIVMILPLCKFVKIN